MRCGVAWRRVVRFIALRCVAVRCGAICCVALRCGVCVAWQARRGSLRFTIPTILSCERQRKQSSAIGRGMLNATMKPAEECLLLPGLSLSLATTKRLDRSCAFRFTFSLSREWVFDRDGARNESSDGLATTKWDLWKGIRERLSRFEMMAE